MLLSTVKDDGLPPLAWCARVGRQTREVLLHHGTGVEVHDHAFCEGAWNGDFDRSDFTNATVFAGSGGRIVDDGVLFASSTDTLERLHLLRTGDAALVSNSLPFLLAAAGDSCDPRYSTFQYQQDLRTILHGIHKYKRTLPTRSGNTVELFYFCNLHLNADLIASRRAKRCPQPFSSYADYRRFLEDELRAVAANAASPSRRVQYPPLTTISSGYDSPACAVIARDIGCKEAVTFKDGELLAERDVSQKQVVSDSGTPIGQQLGITMIEGDRHAYKTMGTSVVAEFLVGSVVLLDLVLAGFEQTLRQRLFITGFLGDGVWDVGAHAVGSEIARSVMGGNSLSEFRLRTGFIHLPLPYMAAVQHPSIHAISRSPEMQPWTLGNDYDRPIPRRIVEEAGVPREMFGQEKKYVAIQAGGFVRRGRRAQHERSLPADVRRELQEFAATHSPYRSLAERVRYRCAYELCWWAPPVVSRAVALARRLGVSWKPRDLSTSRFRQSRVMALEFHWGVEKTKTRYSRLRGAAHDPAKHDAQHAVERVDFGLANRK